MQLTLDERRKMERLRHARVPLNEMAQVLRRHRSTIFRELRRNHFQDPYMPKVVLRPLRTSPEKDGRLNAMPRRCLAWKTLRRGVPSQHAGEEDENVLP
uniref:helix-turn-helix domain-containing protein n=1 Tax=Limimaricola soesokkakensis TaxID=1343159 RepID=UPI003512D51E